MLRLYLLVVSALCAVVADLANAEAKPLSCFESKGIQFLRIPGSEFSMGANTVAGKDVGYKDERPRHVQKVGSFCMMRDNLLPDQAKRLREQFGIALNSETHSDGPEDMTWVEAKRLSQALTKEVGKTIRLPTEAEWEFAARGGLTNKEYPWGDLADTYEDKSVRDIVLHGRLDCELRSVQKLVTDRAIKACIPKDADDFTIFKEFSCVSELLDNRVPDVVPNNFGLVNIVNNDWEWTSSFYMPYPYNALDGRENDTFKEIRGRASAARQAGYRVVRGGNHSQESCKAYTSLRGYGAVGGEYESSYHVRFVLEE